jgi:hypothetical protein
MKHLNQMYRKKCKRASKNSAKRHRNFLRRSDLSIAIALNAETLLQNIIYLLRSVTSSVVTHQRILTSILILQISKQFSHKIVYTEQSQ